MKYIVLLLLVGLSWNQSFGLVNIEQYNTKINKAELSITNGKFKEALNYYESSFKLKEQPFAQDLYNAIVCALKLHLNRKALALSFILADKGVGKSFFEKKSIFQLLKNEEGWQSLLSAAEDAQKSYDRNPIQKRIKDLIEADRIMHTKWFLATQDPNNELRKRMMIVDDSLSLELMDLFKNEGYLSEGQISVGINNDTTINSMPLFGIIILHKAMTYSDTLFSNVLKAALKQGEIKPDVVAKFLDYGGRKGKRSTYGAEFLYMIYKCNLYVNNKLSIPDINSARAELGLCSLDDYLKKVRFVINHPATDFSLNAYSGKIGSFSNLSAEKGFLSNYNLIVNIPDCNN